MHGSPSLYPMVSVFLTILDPVCFPHYTWSCLFFSLFSLSYWWKIKKLIDEVDNQRDRTLIIPQTEREKKNLKKKNRENTAFWGDQLQYVRRVLWVPQIARSGGTWSHESLDKNWESDCFPSIYKLKVMKDKRTKSPCGQTSKHAMQYELHKKRTCAHLNLIIMEHRKTLTMKIHWYVFFFSLLAVSNHPCSSH